MIHTRYIDIRVENTREIIGTDHTDIKYNYSKSRIWRHIRYIALHKEYHNTRIGQLIAEKLKIEAI